MLVIEIWSILVTSFISWLGPVYFIRSCRASVFLGMTTSSLSRARGAFVDVDLIRDLPNVLGLVASA